MSNRGYRVLSSLLLYPEPELLSSQTMLNQLLLEELPDWHTTLQELFAHIGGAPLIDLQQQYVMTFDRNPSHSLHLFEHIHGESRDVARRWWT